MDEYVQFPVFRITRINGVKKEAFQEFPDPVGYFLFFHSFRPVLHRAPAGGDEHRQGEQREQQQSRH